MNLKDLPLLPITRIAGRETSYTLAERMTAYGVPGVSVALFDRGELVEAAGFGRASIEQPHVATDTLFQAASMSKVVGAFVVLQLVVDGVLDLDEDVNRKLRSWHVPENDFTKARPVTLRRILSHRAGLTGHGFAGYSESKKLPSLPDILNGTAEAETPPVFVDLLPDSAQRYSGGGTTIAQLVVEDVTGKSFAAFAEERIFAPLGLRRSTFRIPLPADRLTNIAHRHGPDGAPLETRWNVYPHASAAGLWTTPSEYGRFLAEIRNARHGRSRILSAAAARAMLTRHYGDQRGLGPMVYADGVELRYFHDGDNSGFHCAGLMYLDGGHGAVVMTNGMQGPSFWREWLNGAAARCGWPGYLEPPLREVALSPDELARYVGDYRVTAGPEWATWITLLVNHGRLIGTLVGMPSNVLYAASRTDFRSERTPFTTRFELATDGTPHAVAIMDGTDVLIRAERRARGA